MKIGLIIYGALDTLSGGYLYDRHLVAYLRQAGCTVEILSLPWRNYPSHMSDNFRLHWARQIASKSFDLLLQDELNHPSLFLLNTLLRRLCSTPIIAIVHHLRSSEDHPAYLMPLYREVEKRYLHSVDGFIYNSHTTRNSVERLMGHPKPCVVAFPAADHRKPPTRDIVVSSISHRLCEWGKLQLLFIGNLIHRKGLHTVFAALAPLAAKNWHLHIAGSMVVDRHYSEDMSSRAQLLSLTSQVTFHGRTSDELLAHLLATCDLLVMPSYEGFGIVYLEAMAFGLPVLAANIGAAPELITSGVNGYLVPINDEVALCQKIELFQNNRVHLATLGYYARQRYDAHPTWNESMECAFRWLCEFQKTISTFSESR